MKSLSCVRLFATPWTVKPTRLLCPWDFPGNSTGVDCHFLLQWIFLTQGWNPGLPHCKQTLYHLSHQGSPKMTILSKAIYILSAIPVKIAMAFFRELGQITLKYAKKHKQSQIGKEILRVNNNSRGITVPNSKLF